MHSITLDGKAVAMVAALTVQTLVVPRLGDVLSWLAFLVVLVVGAVAVGWLEGRYGASSTLRHVWLEYVGRRDRTSESERGLSERRRPSG